MHIKTERCTIRDFVSQDIDSFMEYRNNLAWMQYQGFKGETKEAYENELLRHNPLLTEGRQFAIINTTSSQLIGDIYLKQESDIFWMGYTINPLYARQGYAKEAVISIMEWIASQSGKAIKAGVLPENIASISLLKKLNFVCFSKEDGELIYIYNLQKE